MNGDTLRDIAAAGVLAPSADNQHVFRVEVLDAGLRLWPTPAFATTRERHRRVLGLLSLGAVVENMRLRAGELGFAADLRWIIEGGPSAPLVELCFATAATPAHEDLAIAIEARHTTRRMYRGPALTTAEVQALQESVPADAQVVLTWLTGGARRQALRLIWRAESERFQRRGLHDELFSSIRFDLSWSESAEWALAPATLEVEAPMRPLFKALRHWSLMGPLTWVGAHRVLGLRAGWLPCWQAPGLGVLSTPLTAEKGAIAVGGVFERLWLRATRLGLALQPMAASAVLPLQTAAAGGASENMRERVTAGWRDVLRASDPPLMVFRIGRAPAPVVRSGRRPLDDYLTSAADLRSDHSVPA